MIPPLNEHGYLPPGVHRTTLDEVIARFGVGNDQRVAQGQSLIWLVPLCRAAGIVKLLINGSFVTDRGEPNDVDCILLQGPRYSATTAEAAALKQGLPYLEIKIVAAGDYDTFSTIIFATDRDMIPKGVVEVPL